MSKTKVGVVRFLGTNCDRDIWKAIESSGMTPEWLWYSDSFDYKNYSSLIIPGGFSFGDYLRCGALAARCPVMDSVAEAATYGTPILGICNGFQILCEAGLLPGALLRNEHGQFRDDWVNLKLESSHSAFTKLFAKGDEFRLPIAHGDGRYYIAENDLKKLWDSEQVWLSYKENPNGSIANIAGVLNEKKNVSGLMPHPERALADWMGGVDGKAFFKVLEAML